MSEAEQQTIELSWTPVVGAIGYMVEVNPYWYAAPENIWQGLIRRLLQRKRRMLYHPGTSTWVPLPAQRGGDGTER